MTPYATYPTPYGISVPVFWDPADPEIYLFSSESTAICAGIHDPKERARFIADATAAGRCDMSKLHEYGGGPPPRVTLPKPQSPAYPRFPRDSDDDIPIENWVTIIMDAHRWCDRADRLIEIISNNFDGHTKDYGSVITPGLQFMMRATFEHLAESEIDCLEAAAFYALSMHPEWSKPAAQWLRPMAETWFKDWADARPVYRRFASLCQAGSGLPSWTKGGAL